MLRKILFTTILFYIFSTVEAQDLVLKNTNVKALKEMSEEFSKEYWQMQAKIEAYAKEHNLPVNHTTPSGKGISMVGFDSKGKPLYQQTYNQKAANSIATTKVNPNANTANKYNLSGRGFTIGEWDKGAIRLTHREYQGRAIQADNSNDDIEEHGTHVGGTMIAGGIRADIKGMAYEANLNANDWNNAESEMAARAASGILVSNHSYGDRAGWEYVESTNKYEWLGDDAVNTKYDYKFGYYDAKSRDWDRIAFNAPYYLIVKAAGNSRGTQPSPPDPNRPKNGEYDCIATYGVAKNILTVGAVNPLTNGWTSSNSVVISSFTSFGPSDDGRIKPDIVGCGVDVPSLGSASDIQYVTLDGTSMSSPTVAGSCLLLQEHFSNTHNQRKMISSTLKGLVIHTADEAWSFPGPDYRFGWGLMNTRKAADVISNDSVTSMIVEEVLRNQQTKEYDVIARGGQNLIATICWTDLPGVPGPKAYNSRLKMLVNDLDLRVINQSNQLVSLPWRLNPDSAGFGAKKGDNIVDNVEKIEVTGVQPGQAYKIVIRHKRTLTSGSNLPQLQRYSLLVSGIIAGDTAATCRPMQSLNSSFGRFDDGSGTSKNYFNNADCKWVINGIDNGSVVKFSFKTININAGDTLYAYSRGNTGDTLIAKFSGTTLPDTIFSTTPKMLLNFKSDGAGNAAGWDVQYKTIVRPTFDFFANFRSICEGNQVGFSLFTPNGTASDWTYAWTVSAGGTFSNPAIASPTLTFNAAGTFTVTLTISNKAGGSTVTKTSYITVKPAVSTNAAPFLEDFENAAFPNYSATPDKKWTITSDANTWTRNNLAPNEGRQALRIKNYLTSNVIRELVSPGIDLTSVPDTCRNLTFQLAFQQRDASIALDQLRVLVSTDCGQTWTPVFVRNNTTSPRLATVTAFAVADFRPSPTDYREELISLKGFTTGISNMLFKFEMKSDKGNNLFIDNILVGGRCITSNLSTLGDQNFSFNVFPNPSSSNSTININNPKSSAVVVELMDVLGRKLNTHHFNAGQGNISTSTSDIFGSVEKGIYLIKVSARDSEKVLRWVVK